MVYTIVAQLDFYKMYLNFMGWTKNSFMSCLNSQHLYSSYQFFARWNHYCGDKTFSALESCRFLWLNIIWMLITDNPGMNHMEYFSDTSIQRLGGWSICANWFMSVNCFESICFHLKFTSNPPLSSLLR